MSDAALTDSTTPQASPASTLRPTAGSSMNTRSPSASCAWSVMPTVNAPSGSARTHSWLSVYLSSAGTFMTHSPDRLGNEYLAVAHERRLDHARGEQLAANLDVDEVA